MDHSRKGLRKWKDWFDHLAVLIEEANYQGDFNFSLVQIEYKAGSIPQKVAAKIMGQPVYLPKQVDALDRQVLEEFLAVLKKHHITQIKKYISVELLEILNSNLSNIDLANE